MAPATPTPPAEALLGALAERLDATAVELAQAVGIGRSTAGKLLVTLAGEGRVVRHGGGHQGGRRHPDHWALAAPAPPPPASDPDVGPVAPAATGQGPEPAPAPPGPRLGAGQLRHLVLAYLADRPGQALSPTAIAKALGRSAGAVANALGVLAGQGAVAQTQESPRRYTVADDHRPAHANH
jgi:hypothetical protein